MARKQHHNSISLFPFLAVLVCAMGALILLLLVMTRKIRQDQNIEHAQALAASVAVSAPVADRSAEIADLEVQLSATRITMLEKQAKSDALRRNVEEQRKRQKTLRLELDDLQRRLSDATESALPSDVAGVLKQTHLLSEKEADLLRELDEQERSLLEKQQQLTHATDDAKETVLMLHEKKSALVSLRAQIQDSQSKQQATSGTATLLEFSNSTGTTRTPIVIDVTAQGFEMLPNGIRISSNDMEGFPVRDNPLLSAVLTAHRHRTGNSLIDEPYVLLLIRPDGCLPFYLAQRILAESHIHYGYELLKPGREVVSGETDPTELPVVQSAMQDAFKRRENLYSKLRAIAQQGAGHSGTGSDSGWESHERRLSIRADGRVIASEPDERRPLDGRFYAGGVAPPASYFRDRPAGGYQGLDPDRLTPSDAEKLADEFAAQYAQQQAAERANTIASSPPANNSLQASAQPGDSFRSPAEQRFARMLFGGDGSLQASEVVRRSHDAAADATSLQGSAAIAEPRLPAGDPSGEVSTRRPDLSHIDADLLRRFQTSQQSSGSLSTPVGITVFLDQYHMTVGQERAFEITHDTRDAALAAILTGINTELEDVRRDPKEPLMPIVKFIVSPGGEKWRIPLAQSLKEMGVHSAAVFELTPYMISQDDTGYANVLSSTD